MRVVVQRCKNASVSVDNKTIGKIDKGMVLLVGFTHNDSDKEIEYMIDKIINLRIFDDENGVMNKSILDIEGEILSISQFTLYADASKGRRPSYINAMKSDIAIEFYDKFNIMLREKVKKVEVGKFGAEMQVKLINDGPVTILLERGGEDGK